ncbi:MAG: DUF4258 domain-containing protein [Thermoplasmatales archaeon]|nr:DUF4258 domain-containing protein [Thermoplasmatales archaeon]
MDEKQKIINAMDQALYYTDHARIKMIERNITREDIRMVILHGIITGTGKEKNITKYKLRGRILDGRLLVVVCVIQNGCLIITTYEATAGEKGVMKYAEKKKNDGHMCLVRK